MEKTFKGTIKGREFEAFKDGRLILDRGPTLDATTMEEIRGAAHAFFSARHRPEPEVVVQTHRTEPVGEINMAKARREAAIRARCLKLPPKGLIEPLPVAKGCVVPPRMEEHWLGVKPLQVETQMLAQLRTNYEHWVAEGHSHDEVILTLEKRIRPLVHGVYWRARDAQMRLASAWRRLRSELSQAAS